jgi:hypothetical protein
MIHDIFHDSFTVEDLSKKIQERDLSRDQLVALLAKAEIENREMQKHLVMVKRAEPALSRADVLAFEPRQVAAGECITLIANGYVPFRGERLAIDSKCAPYFFVRGLYVGQRVSGANVWNLAATLFPPLPTDLPDEELQRFADHLKIEMSTLQLGMNLSLAIQNVSSHARLISACVWGRVPA